MTCVRAEVTDTALDVAAAMAAVSVAGAGALAVFVGQVRNSDPGAPAPVVALEYSAHPHAQNVLARIAAEVSHPDARVAVSHRVGRLEVSEIALVACVSTPHRAEAFELCRHVVEAVKAHLPVWKRQVYADGTSTWVNCA